MPFKPRKDHLDLGPHFYHGATPVDFGDLKLRYFNARAAQSVGLEHLSQDEIERRFGRFEPFDGSLPQPLALSYHGHQFGVYNPEIGDGRGFLYAQCQEIFNPSHDPQDGPQMRKAKQGRLVDFGTKGSGTTLYSRSGDGRLTLKGAIRELLATSMLAAQGVSTSRTFTIFEDLDARLYRSDEPSPARGAILTRLSHAHIRFGTFQRLAYKQQPVEIERLVRYCLRRYFHVDETQMDANAAVCAFYAEVIRRTALTAAAWMMAGFVHGVLNTDNMNITGESFDYGPWRWVPTYDGAFTAAYFDTSGRYAYGRQPQAVAWNLSALGQALAAIHHDTAPLSELLQGYSAQLQDYTIDQFFWRMRLTPSGNRQVDVDLVEACLKQLKAEQSPFEDLFHASSTGRLDRLSQPLQDLLAGWPGDPINHDPETMLVEEVEKIWAAIDAQDDWGPLNEKLRRLEHLYDLRQAWKAPAIYRMERPI